MNAEDKKLFDQMFSGLLQPKELEQMEAFVSEAWDRAAQIKESYGSTTRGFMLYMMALYIQHWMNPEMFKGIERTPIRIQQWFAAGAPEDLAEVPKMLLERMLMEMMTKGQTIQ